MDTPTFEQAYSDYHPRIVNWLCQRTGSVEQAEDLAGEVWERAWRNWQRWTDDDVKGLLFRVAVNLLKDEWRRAKLYRFQSIEQLLQPVPDARNADGAGAFRLVEQLRAADDTEDEALARIEPLTERQIALRRAWRRLPTRYRQTLRAGYSSGRTFPFGDSDVNAVATTLDVSYAAAKALLFRSRNSLCLALGLPTQGSWRPRLLPPPEERPVAPPPPPSPPVPGICQHCGAPIVGRIAQAIYCSRRCKDRALGARYQAQRRRARERGQGQRPIPQADAA